MLDTCQIGTRADPSGGDRSPGTPSYGSEIACGVGTNVAPVETKDGSERTVTEVPLRLPIGTSVNAEDYIQVTKRHGTAISPNEVYQVIGIPTRGPTALVARAKRVQGVL